MGSTAVKSNKSSNSPPKWMSSSAKNNSDDSTEAEGRNSEKLNLTNRLNSVIGNGNFEKAPEIVVESKDAEEVKAKPKWKRPGTSAAEPKTIGPVTNATSKLGENVKNPKTSSVAPKKESKNELQPKKKKKKKKKTLTKKKKKKKKKKK